MFPKETQDELYSFERRTIAHFLRSTTSPMEIPNSRLLFCFTPDALPYGKTACRLEIDNTFSNMPLSLDVESPEFLLFDSLSDSSFSSPLTAIEYVSTSLYPKKPKYGLWTDLTLIGHNPRPSDFQAFGDRIQRVKEYSISPVTVLLRMGPSPTAARENILGLMLLQRVSQNVSFFIEASADPRTQFLCSKIGMTSVNNDSQNVVLLGPIKNSVRPADAQNIFLAPLL